jgi:c-di-GMP-binding flagellar brake protein YcgR
MEKSSSDEERRKYPRVSFQGGFPAKVFSKGISPIDISATGMLLESPRPLAAKAVKTLRIELGPKRQLLIKGRVVRNYVHSFEKADTEMTVVKYRVAIEFIFSEEDDQKELQAFINRLEQSKARTRLEIKKPDFPGPDRRRVSRIEAVAGLGGQVAIFLDFQLLQLSAGGMMVKLAVPLSVGTPHIFNLSVDESEMEIQGVVLECEPLPGSRESVSYRVVIQFHSLDSLHQELLEHFVEKQLARQG